MLDEVLEALNVQSGGSYIDGTFGRGGHARSILDRLGSGGSLTVIDKDPEAIKVANELQAVDPRVKVIHGSFSGLAQAARATGAFGTTAGVFLDLGVSSPQLDDPRRGFSFSHDGPLDMRMDTGSGVSAAQWLATVSEQELITVLREYGEERFARRIARAIVAAVAEGPLTTTGQLAELISKAVPRREPGKHPATRSFQAIRIFINHELDDVREGLQQALQVLQPGGRLVVISFHSLEDRIVKRFMRDQSRGPQLPPDLPIQGELPRGPLRVLGKAMRPGKAEVQENPRARSAVLRVAERVA